VNGQFYSVKQLINRKRGHIFETQCSVDIYRVTHTVYSVNGSKSHTVREAQS